ncbi:MAG TPA: outer membrane beta-barrel protein [Vicinamibacteria bacterium]|nr:outer membrane beta-barrel protein [Vicinamibacteria bacterium]
MRLRRAVPAALVALAALATPTSAEELRIAIEGGWYDWTNAKNSAKAVFDKSGGPVGGLSLEYGFSRSLFGRAGVRFNRMTGERAFVAAPGQPAFRLGHELTAELIPVYGMVGLRFGSGRSMSPYVGIGGGITSYSEESEVAGETFSTSKTAGMGLAAVGIDFGSGRIRFGAEGTYAMAPGTIGDEGVSQVYDEDDVGGFSVLGRVTIAF